MFHTDNFGIPSKVLASFTWNRIPAPKTKVSLSLKCSIPNVIYMKQSEKSQDREHIREMDVKAETASGQV